MRRWLRQCWTQSASIAMLVGFVVFFLVRLDDWPTQIPLRIGWSGEATAWGSPWLVFLIVVGLGTFFVALSALIDSLWAAQETAKRFNALTLLDELVVGLLVTIQAALLHGAAGGETVFRIPLGGLLGVVGGALLVGSYLESRRPFVAHRVPHAVRGNVAAFREQLAERIKRGERIVFWDIQNPQYVDWLSLGLPLLFWIAAGFLARSSLWVAAIEASVGLLLLQFYGGQRTRVDVHGITIRYGLAGLRIFRCELGELSGIRIRSFAPLAEFGGYGIRMAGGVRAFYLAGTRGVQLELPGRRSALIGTENPERLAAVIEVLSGVSSQPEQKEQE